MKVKIHAGQQVRTRLRLIRTDPYKCQDGREIVLQVWRSTCADCGEFFELKAPLRARRFEPNKRCDKHKRPGVKAKPFPDNTSQLADVGVLPIEEAARSPALRNDMIFCGAFLPTKNCPRRQNAPLPFCPCNIATTE